MKDMFEKTGCYCMHVEVMKPLSSLDIRKAVCLLPSNCDDTKCFGLLEIDGKKVIVLPDCIGGILK